MSEVKTGAKKILIAAVSENGMRVRGGTIYSRNKESIFTVKGVPVDGLIGYDNRIPWSVPEDLKFFRETTRGGGVIMGRKTYESIGRPLLRRRNYVVSSKMCSSSETISGRPPEEAKVFSSLTKALSEASRENENVFIIGGAVLYKASLPLVDEMLISLIPGEPYAQEKAPEESKGVFFPYWNEEDWSLGEERKFASFTLYRYVRKSR